MKNDHNALIDVEMNKNYDVRNFRRGATTFQGLQLFQTLEYVTKIQQSAVFLVSNIRSTIYQTEYFSAEFN